MRRRWKAFIFLAALLVTTLSFASFASAHTDNVKVLHLTAVQNPTTWTLPPRRPALARRLQRV